MSPILAIAVAIHAAIVGGVIGGIVIVGGIVVTEWLTRVRDRSYEVRRATYVVTMKLPIALAYMSAQPPDERRVEFGTPGWNVYQEVQTALVEIDAATRHRGIRNRRSIRIAQEDLSARLLAAHFRCFQRGQYLTNEERYGFGTDVLHRAVFGPRNQIDAKFKRYIDDGFSEPTPP